MKKNKHNLFKTMLVSLVMAIIWMPYFASADNTLQIHPTNPRYFTDDSGKAIYLTGSHTWWNIHYTDYGGTNPQMNYDDFEDYLDWMQDHGHNFVRLWTCLSWMETPPEGTYPEIWLRTGPGYALDGHGLKYDMTKFDQDYFSLIRQRIQQIENHEMYCSVMFFGSLISTGNKEWWREMAWYPDNNINSELKNAFDVNNGLSFFTTDIGALNIQRAFVRKMVDTLNDFDHVIWEIANEAPIQESINWQKGMVNYTRSYEASKPKKHLIGITSDGRDSTSYLINGPSDWISPDRYGDNYRNGGPADYNDKIVIADTDHLWGWSQPEYVEDMQKWVWKTFTRGNHPIFMDPYNSNIPEQGYDGSIDSAFNPVRDAMGHTLVYANKFSDLASMVPSETISSTTYCLANQGNEYLVYQPGTGAFTVNLEAGDYDYEWFNPDTGIIVSSGTVVASGGSKSFTPPFSGDAVLYLQYISIPFSDPTLYLKFEEGSGTTALDSSGNNNNGEIHGALYTIGKIGNYSLDFDGVNDYINLPVFTLPAAFSYNAWVNWPADNKTRTILDNDTDTRWLGQTSTSQLAFYDGSTLSFGSISPGWRMITVTYNPALSSNNLKAFVDGEVLEKSFNKTYGAVSSGWLVGDDGYDNFWKGGLDEVKIYNHALTQVEIAELYAVGASCTEFWTCTDWPDWSEECINNQKVITRTCTDQNECGTENEKPKETETQACESPDIYGISNFIQLVSDWLKSETNLTSDLNNDNTVNTRDLGIMMSRWE